MPRSCWQSCCWGPSWGWSVPEFRPCAIGICRRTGAGRQRDARRLGAALAVVIWNFCGWENLSVVAAEIKGAQRNYARASAIVLPMVVIGYLLPLLVGTAVVSNPCGMENRRLRPDRRSGWADPTWAERSRSAELISALAIFQAAMLWVSRMPFVLAREGSCPRP